MKVSKTHRGASRPVKAGTDNYKKAREHIQCAMECMTERAKTDVTAKTAITDLAVVLFDLSNTGGK